MNEEPTGPLLRTAGECKEWVEERPLPGIPAIVVMLPPNGLAFCTENTNGDLGQVQQLIANTVWWGLNEIRHAAGMQAVRTFTQHLVEIAFHLDQPFDPHAAELPVFQPGEYELIQEFERYRESDTAT